MSNLRSLFPDSNYNVVSTSSPLTQLFVYNTNVSSVQNGGQCCLWTVPSGVYWAKFEVWGGGGDGPGACCCQQTQRSGGSGSYARRTISVRPGDTFRVCAGSTGCCAPNCCGTVGFPSYVNHVSVASSGSNINLCASGGGCGRSECFWMFSNGWDSTSIVEGCGCTCGSDFSICGISGASHAAWCGFQSYGIVPGPTYIGSGARLTFDYCNTGSGCFMVGGYSIFPGGGGGGANANGGGCCWGGWGAGGLVIISYK